MRLFCKGVPVRSRRLWLQRDGGEGECQQVPGLASTPLGPSSLPTGAVPRPPVEVEQRLPALRLEVLDVLRLIQDEVAPVLAAERLVVLQHQLVRRDAHVEGIGLGPALRNQENSRSGAGKGRKGSREGPQGTENRLS